MLKRYIKRKLSIRKYRRVEKETKDIIKYFSKIIYSKSEIKFYVETNLLYNIDIDVFELAKITEDNYLINSVIIMKKNLTLKSDLFLLKMIIKKDELISKKEYKKNIKTIKEFDKDDLFAKMAKKILKKRIVV